ncbi:hypothetical protein L1887_45744 [Cichorium endivia]|nr:hypothetical protein L1887_45744 [Cichorium endivia]
MIFNVHMQRVIRVVKAPVVDHVHRVEGGNVKRFFRGPRILSVDGIVMAFIPRRVANLRQHPAQRSLPVVAVVKVDRIEMKAEIAQLRQEHHPPVRTFPGQALQPAQHVLFERRAERIVRVVERGGGKAISPHADGRQQRQFIEIQPGHKDAVAEFMGFRLKAAVA